MTSRHTATEGLFDVATGAGPRVEKLAKGAAILRGFARDDAPALLQALDEIVAASPFRHMIVPSGQRMSVAMTNCGRVGWVTDTRGYRYDDIDPVTERPWPCVPALFSDLGRRAAAAAGFEGYEPDSCLINRYEPGARLTLHQDRNERDYSAPIVSVSLGLPAAFLFGGVRRAERTRRIALAHGDVVIWGGPARLTYHGVTALTDGEHPLTGRCRINLTFRKAL